MTVLQKIGFAILGLLLLPPLSPALAQSTTLSVQRKVALSVLNDPNIQYYEFTYSTNGASIWGAGVPGSQQVDFDLPLAPQVYGQNIGAFFNPCFLYDCTFGAGLTASLIAQPSVGFHARADAGSVDLYCPIGVLIEYPDSRNLKPGTVFTVKTELYIPPGASMNINPPHLGTTVSGAMTGKIDLAITAKAFGNDLINIELFRLLGLPTPTVSVNRTLVNTGNLAQSIDDIPIYLPPLAPQTLYGAFHVPRMAARGNVRYQEGLLRARAADSFLSMNLDITNALIQYAAFGIPIPFNGAYGAGGFGGEFQLLDFKLRTDLGLAQNLTFDPRPTIVFKAGSQTKTIRAGESATFRLPTSSPLRITPTIYPSNNRFSNALALTLTPSLSFDLLHITGYGRVAGHDLFSFDLRPLGTQRLEDTYALDMFNTGFALPAPPTFTAPTQILGSLSAAILATKIEPKVLTGTAEDGTELKGKIRNYNPALYYDLNVQGTSYGYRIALQPGGTGDFSARIDPGYYYYLPAFKPLTVQIEARDANQQLVTTTNPITIYWQRADLVRQQFGRVELDPDFVENDRIATYQNTGRFRVQFQGERPADGATLLYDDMPIPTAVEPTSDGYDLFGTIAPHLIDQGGIHRISFLNAGLNAESVLLQEVVIQNGLPQIIRLLPLRAADGTASLIIHGDQFTQDSQIGFGGVLHDPHFVSRSELRADLLPADLTPGDHTVTVTNPAPGGGTATGIYTIAQPQPEAPRLAATHSLLRREVEDTVADTVTLKNLGKNDLRDVTVTAVRLFIGSRIIVGQSMPATLPYLASGGNGSSLQVIFPPQSSQPGDTGVIQVQGTVQDKVFTLSQRVTLPQPGAPPK